MPADPSNPLFIIKAKILGIDRVGSVYDLFVQATAQTHAVLSLDRFCFSTIFEKHANGKGHTVFVSEIVAHFT